MAQSDVINVKRPVINISYRIYLVKLVWLHIARAWGVACRHLWRHFGIVLFGAPWWRKNIGQSQTITKTGNDVSNQWRVIIELCKSPQTPKGTIKFNNFINISSPLLHSYSLSCIVPSFPYLYTLSLSPHLSKFNLLHLHQHFSTYNIVIIINYEFFFFLFYYDFTWLAYRAPTPV